VKKEGEDITLISWSRMVLSSLEAAEIWAQITEHSFDYLDAPVVRIAGKDAPIPFSPVLEKAAIPDKSRIIEGIKNNFC